MMRDPTLNAMRWVVIGVAALLVGLLAYGIVEQGAKTTASAALEIGERPPNTAESLPAWLGRHRHARRLPRQGRARNFWGSWCPPCTDELPLLEKTHRSWRSAAGPRSAQLADKSEAALEFVDDLGITFPSLRDGEGDVGDQWGAAQFPESLLLDCEGRS